MEIIDPNNSMSKDIRETYAKNCEDRDSPIKYMTLQEIIYSYGHLLSQKDLEKVNVSLYKNNIRRSRNNNLILNKTWELKVHTTLIDNGILYGVV